ncbi:MAG TPA: OsmC family protein [Terriglobales bacterium]|jgi:lipoyl-dependent peroxiredoxin|nr:OsmC family protein [Terriglobales bacterium]
MCILIEIEKIWRRIMKRIASAVWVGGFIGGKGFVSTSSGAISNISYSFKTRFEDHPGTNPEELIAAAQAGCFSMALAAQLESNGFNPRSIDTSATVTLEQQSGKWNITAIRMDVIARVPGLDRKTFEKAAREAKNGCPVSRVLKAKITMDAMLEPESKAA